MAEKETYAQRMRRIVSDPMGYTEGRALMPIYYLPADATPQMKAQWDQHQKTLKFIGYPGSTSGQADATKQFRN